MTDSFDARAAAIASEQTGNVCRWQLLRLGLGAKAIAYRVRVGRLYPVFPGVYSVGLPPASPLQLAHAAVLACGEGSLVAEESALALWGFVRHWPATPRVLTPHNRHSRGIIAHRSRTLDGDGTVQRGVPVVTPARAILDSARRLGARLTRVVNEALISPYMTIEQLTETHERHLNHPAAGLLLPYIELDDGPTDSELEDALFPFCDGHDIPRPRVRAWIGRRRVDALYERERVILEIDGWLTHRGRDRFENDRERDADHLALGYVTVRITKRRLIDRAPREAERLRQILARRRIELGLPPGERTARRAGGEGTTPGRAGRRARRPPPR